MIFSKIEIIDGECYVKLDILENEIKKSKMQEQALNEIKEETIKWDSSNTCAIDDYYFKEKILQIIDKVGGNE